MERKVSTSFKDIWLLFSCSYALLNMVSDHPGVIQPIDEEREKM